MIRIINENLDDWTPKVQEIIDYMSNNMMGKEYTEQDRLNYLDDEYEAGELGDKEYDYIYNWITI